MGPVRGVGGKPEECNVLKAKSREGTKETFNSIHRRIYTSSKVSLESALWI